MWIAVEDGVNLLAIVTVLPEDVHQEHQLSLQTVFIAKSSSPVQQYGSTACLLDGWWWDPVVRQRLVWVGLLYTLWPKEQLSLL
jgi:hypothetical protein